MYVQSSHKLVKYSTFKTDLGDVMNTDTKKIMLACFIGGFIGTFVAFAVTPNFWWLGLIAGFPGGYLAYEFRGIGPAMKVAYSKTSRRGSKTFTGIKKHWFEKTYPIGHICFVSAIICTVLLYSMLGLTDNSYSSGYFWLSTLLFPVPFYFAFIFSVVIIGGLAHQGAMLKKLLPLTDPFHPYSHEKELLLDEGYTEVEADYQKVFGWIWFAISSFLISIPKTILLAVKFPFKFSWLVFKQIHSHKRLLCGVDSAIGVAVAFLLFHSSVDTQTQHLAVSAFGGMIGAGWGILNWEIVSKRLLNTAGQE